MGAAGVGKNILTKEPGGFERMGRLGIQYGSAWKIALNGGYWLAQAPGEKASHFAALQGGLQVVGSSGMVTKFMIGPSWVQNPDSKLSGHFQFNPVFGIGMTDSASRTLMLEWSHWSNAGWKLPNLGRDIICLTASVPLYRH